MKQKQTMTSTTADEIEFIDGIGYGPDHTPTNRSEDCPHLFTKGRRELLEIYLTIKNKDWGDINSVTVMEHAMKALRGL